MVRTRDRVRPGRWNRLTVFRHDWGVWLQLNDGPREEGRSRGLFSRITFQEPVALGGVGGFANAGRFLDFDEGAGRTGFAGCVRRIEINNRVYALGPAEKGGDAIYGVDIGIT